MEADGGNIRGFWDLLFFPAGVAKDPGKTGKNNNFEQLSIFQFSSTCKLVLSFVFSLSEYQIYQFMLAQFVKVTSRLHS